MVPASTPATSAPQLEGRLQFDGLLQLERLGEILRSWLPELEVAALSVVATLLVLAVGFRLAVPALARVVRARNARNPTVVDALERYSRLVVVLVAVLVGMRVAGFGNVLAGSALVVAAATLALGVAGQEVIGNLVSGLFLVADPEFNVDDWIAWEDGEGVVEAINLRVTRVRTVDGELVTVPNTTLTTTAVTQPYSREGVRVDERVGIAHHEDARRAREVVREAVEAVEGVTHEPEPVVVVEELGEDALWLRALFWIDDASRRAERRARSTYLLALQERLKAEGIDFSPPSDHAISGEVAVRSPGDEQP